MTRVGRTATDQPSRSAGQLLIDGLADEQANILGHVHALSCLFVVAGQASHLVGYQKADRVYNRPTKSYS
jgi:hypothetical protein